MEWRMELGQRLLSSRGCIQLWSGWAVPSWITDIDMDETGEGG